jgi:soluble lytic murein transglycosylase-like protein
MAATPSVYRPRIKRIAARYDLDPLLVEAIVMVESSDHTDAFRFEPAYFRRYIRGKPEWANWVPRRVASSYGLMQVMYPTALLNGWEGEPEELFLPDVGLNAGCARLRYLIGWAARLASPGATGAIVRASALAAYNGGQGGNGPGRAETESALTLRTAEYPPKVKSWMTRLRA